MVQLELKDIKGGELEQEHSCSLNEFPELTALAEKGGPRFVEPLVFHLRFQPLGRFVEVDGSLSTTVILRCGRCLQDFESPLSESFSLTFVPQRDDEVTEEDLELEADDLGLITYRDDILKLQEPLQEQLLMAVPISPLCETSCRGLCPSCGTNLNIEKCDCVRKPFNNKFNVLADINFNKP